MGSKFSTRYSALIEAKRLEDMSKDKNLLPVYASSTAKILPYQIAAARFALRSDFLKGCILCDEGSLGKTYEALLVAGQKWYEGKENILVVLPSNLVTQWKRKLDRDFTLPYVFWNNTKNIPDEDGIVLTTYDCAIRHADKVKERDWDLAIFDEADVLANYTKDTTVILKNAVREAYKLLLTPTPITKDIRDIYGLIHFIDESILPDVDWFYKRYFRKPENYPELTKWVSQFCFRTLKTQATEYVNFPRRLPITVDYPLIQEEKELYKLISTYIASDDKVAYPEIDEYNLNLLFFKTLSSSPQAFVNMISPAIQRTYGLEKAALLHIQKLASEIKINSKTTQLLKILKTVFNHLKATKVNQKAIVFVDNNTTLDNLYMIFRQNGYNTLKYKDNDTLENFRNDEDVQILVTTDTAAKGLDIEYCPVVVNYDMIYNSIQMEQRICRCHRQGQNSDVLVINLLSHENFADVRMLELINKRTLQFNGIFGMSDDIVGNFDVKINEVLKDFRHRDEVARAFQENLTEHRQANEQLVENSEDILFTTFTKSIADKVTVTPAYIEEKTEELNNDLWELVKYYFETIKPDWYEIDDENKTLTLIDGYKRPYLFSFNDNGRMRNYEGYKKYGLGKEFKPQTGRISFTSAFAKGILREIDTNIAPEAKIYVNADIEPCEIGFYNIAITSKDVSSSRCLLIGQTKSGETLPDEKCRKLLSLPVIEIEERTNLEKIRLGSLLKDFGNLDEKISKDNKLDLSERYSKAAQRAIIQALEKADNRPVIRDANKEVTVKLKKQAILSPEFRELWDKIKQKTTYRVNIDTETLIKNCVKELSEMPVIPKAKLVSSTAEIELENAGVSSTEMHRRSLDIAGSYEVLPDIVRLISAETLLKRSDIIRILQESGRIKDFINNPQGFYEKALEIISRNRHSLAIDGIKYVKLAGEEYYVQEIFDSAELLANLDRNAVQVEHSVYDYLIYDSGVESRFAKSLDEDPDVKMFFKIPPRFKIETPIGSYNPDWAVFLEKDGEQKLYFVLETKGTTSLFDLRSPERLKIHCGKQHFDALQDGILFSEQPVKDWKEFKINV